MNSILMSSFGKIGALQDLLDWGFSEDVTCDFSISKKCLELNGSWSKNWVENDGIVEMSFEIDVRKMKVYTLPSKLLHNAPSLTI